MTDNLYSVKEIIEIQFRNQSKELMEIKQLLKDQNIQVEKRFTQIEKDIDNLRMDNARYKVIWGIGATLGATVFAFLLNKII